MSVVEPGPSTSGLVDRVRNIIMTPTAEWTKIEAERPTIGSLYMGYIMPLAAIPIVAGAIGTIVFGVGGFGFHITMNPISVLIGAVVQYLFTLAGVFIMALVIDGLAGTFGGKRDQMQALKVAAYSATAGWIAGIVGIFPPIALLAIFGLYSLFLLYRGLPILMKAPAERALGYTATVIIVLIVLGILIGTLSTCMMGGARLAALGGMGLAARNDARVEGKVTLPGGGSVDLGQMQQAAKQMEAQSQAMANGSASPVTPVSTDALKALLPDSINGYTRTDLSTGTGGAVGYSGATAQGTYTKGDARLNVSVVDMGGAGAFTAMAQALGVNASTENANGYEKVGTVDGRMTTEKLDRAAKTAEFMTIVAKRFVIEAEGTNVSVDDVKAAVDAVGVPKVEALAASAHG